MTPEQEKRAYELFRAALTRPAPNRSSFIAEACGADASMRSHIEAMVAAHERLESDATAEPAAAPAAAPPTSTMFAEPTQIGPYRILHPLGHGGMGSVYLGLLEDGGLARRAAVKVLRPGLASPQMLARFMVERRLLAALNHPNIARLYDVGETDTGQPYFALEFVEGQPIDEYCDRRKLAIPERLELFRAVCSAVHYAHQNLIVHRDIKPGNIMVTKEGVAKLLDFGIAKLLNADLAPLAGNLTTPETRVMTLAYASPEQVRGEPISTASDIYSLGVLLYELLTGHRPYRLVRQSRAEAERIVCEAEPERPSTAVCRTEEVEPRDDTPGAALRTVTPATVTQARSESGIDRLQRRLRGDLDNIVLMAMRKEPQRRYRSAEELSDDLRRHLADLPVIARPPTFLYVAGKFVSRHRAAVAVVSLAAMSLALAGLLAYRAKSAAAERATAEARRIELEAALERESLEKQLAETRRVDAEARGEMIALLFGEAREAILKISGATETMAMIAAKEVEARQAIAAASPDDPDATIRLADAIVELAKVQGGSRNPSLGQQDSAEPSLRRAMDLCQGVLRSNPGHAGAKRLVAAIHAYLGDALLGRGQHAAAIEQFSQSLQVQGERYEAGPGEIEPARDYGIALMNMVKGLAVLGDGAAARDLMAQVIPLRERLVRQSEGTKTHGLIRRDLAIAYSRLGGLLAEKGDLDGAREQFERSLRIRLELQAASGELGREWRDLAIGHRQLGLTLRRLGDAGSAEHLQRYVDLIGSLGREDLNDNRAQEDALRAFDEIGPLHAATADVERTLANLQLYLPILVERCRARPDDVAARRRLMACRGDIGEMLSELGVRNLALGSYRKALELARELAPDAAAKDEARLDLARVLVAICERFGRDEPGACDEATSLVHELMTAQPADAANAELASLRDRLAGDRP